jgi:DNA-directed DNA polymerase III PolC
MDGLVHLEVTSAYSFLWGTFTPEALVRAAGDLGQRAVALTDDGLFGAGRFWRAARSAGIQPILGARLELSDGDRLILLVQNQVGYENLCRLLSLNLAESMRPRPKASLVDLRRLSRGLIGLAGGWGSAVRRSAVAGEVSGAADRLNRLKGCFPAPGRLFAVLGGYGLPEDDRANRLVGAAARRAGLPLVAAGGVAFLRPGDHDLHRTMIGIQRRHHHRRVDPLPADTFYLTDGREMIRRTGDHEASANTARVARLCRGFRLPQGRALPPTFQAPGRAADRLAVHCRSELARRMDPVPAEYADRLEEELAVIGRRGLGDFFLLVRDVGQLARRRGIRHSVRGSAAGSLVVHLLLGGVDPVAHDLLFERFINDGRDDLPDVDVDFDSTRRDEVIRWLMDRFPEQTAMTAAVATLKVRSAVRLTARGLGWPLEAIDRLTACLPGSLNKMSLETALIALPELRDSPLQNEPELVRVADRLARLPYQPSVHLGGLVVAPGRVHRFTPKAMSPKGFPVGQLDKDDVEAMGLLKLDLLGLRMHTALREAEAEVRRQGVDLDLDRLPLDDPETYAMLRRTDSVGVFQIESPGQRQLLGRLQPKTFFDLIVEISLFRPGPVEGNMVSPFVRRALGQEPVRMPHPSLEPVLEETYGLILFQEQVLRIVHRLAGLGYGEADAFRRTMTKDRQGRRMERLAGRFERAAMEKGHPASLARMVWEQILNLAAYGFCKAHAASFAHITYQSAWLKAHYPLAFYLGLLNAGQVGSYPPSVLLNEARRRGLAVHAPHVNFSEPAYHAEDGGIRVPLTVIGGFGPAASRRVIAERRRGGRFGSREDLFRRTGLPGRLRRALIDAGATDGLAVDSGFLWPELAGKTAGPLDAAETREGD